ncbi:recombinase family protein [uncultured Ruminococcus sp.]|uniref:recombinase family protein n=1 Tax=uncultured Ruminococcus sp. TaxID=165186 RepID=UPI0025D2B7F9|nr:recombinase family protein [uncultured Ruminococcus sp.]
MSDIKTAANVTLIPAKEQANNVYTGKKMRVAAYARVSTDETEQLNSFGVQIAYYTDYIGSRPDWQMIGIFADEGISGTQTENRTQFNRMIELCRKGKIDLILCKSISRFARNTVDCLDYVRELKRLNVAVQFEKENINTLSVSSEFAITLYASFAQAESESISRNITWGIEKSFKEGNVRYQMRYTLGYRLVDGVPQIIEDEAAIVREIFTLFAGGMSMRKIAERLTEKGAARRNGSTVWNRDHVNAILKNEKYVGDAILQKYYTVDCLTHQSAKNNGQKPKYLVQNCHAPIIDRETWDKVQLELSRRSAMTKGNARGGRYRTEYALSELLVCGNCGCNYKRVLWKSGSNKRAVWRCKSTLDGGKARCDSPSLHEEALHSAIVRAINAQILDSSGFDRQSSISANSLENENADLERRISAISTRLEDIESERNSLLADISAIPANILGNNLKLLHTEEQELKAELDELNRKRDSGRHDMYRIKAARELTHGIEALGEFDNDLVRQLVEEITVKRVDRVVVKFCGGEKVTVKV